MPEKIEKYIHLINSIHKSSIEKNRPILEHISGDVVKMICEMVYNILKGVVPITDKELHRLRNLKHVFKRLILKSLSIKNKRQIILENIKSMKLIIGPVLRYFSTPAGHKE
jgi:alanine dehydrogenase